MNDKRGDTDCLGGSAEAAVNVTGPVSPQREDTVSIAALLHFLAGAGGDSRLQHMLERLISALSCAGEAKCFMLGVRELGQPCPAGLGHPSSSLS